VSPRFNIHRTHQVSVLRKTTVHALETCLRLAVVGADVLTDRAGLAGVVGWHSQHLTAAKGLLVGQLSPELVPALVEDRPIQAGFGGDVGARILGGAFGGARHIADLKILDHDHGVVLANRCRGLVKVVSPNVGDPRVNPVDFGFLLFPVGREFYFFGQGALRSGQRVLVFFEGADRLLEGAV